MHKLTVSNIEQNTPETVVVTFDVPSEFKDEYTYKQGQHLTLRTDVNGEDLRRSYSICSSVADNTLRVAIRKVEEGKFSTFANGALKVGDILDVLKPAGHFYVDLDKKAVRTYVAFAAGSGITPILSIIKTTLESEPMSRFLLFYGNRTGSSTIFRCEISDLKNCYMDRFSHYHFLSQQDVELDFFKGRLDGNKVDAILDRIIATSDIDHAFVCGPEAMIDDITVVLAKAGMADNTIHSEKFLSEGQKAMVPKSAKKATGLAKMTLVIDGEEQTISADHKVAILDAAIESGLEVPFACKGGVCCTCRAKVLKGEVEMTLNQGLEPEEVAAGYVLTCQSFAISGEVTLSYDD